MAALPEEVRPVLDSGVPAVLASCSADGEPNVTVISRLYYVDENHLGVSYQFLSKTKRNVIENPHVSATIIDLATLRDWEFDLEFVRSETEGPTFDAMDMAIEAIASMTGMSGVFKLKAADIYRVNGFVTRAMVEETP